MSKLKKFPYQLPLLMKTLAIMSVFASFTGLSTRLLAPCLSDELKQPAYYSLGSQKAAAGTRTGHIGTSIVTWNLTPEQITKADPLLAQLGIKEQTSSRLIIKAQLQLKKLFMQPMPDRKAVYDLQGQIDKCLEDLQESNLKMALQIRAMLKPEQRKVLGFLNHEDVITGIELTPAQVESYNRLERPYLLTSLSTAKQLTQLHLEQSFLLQQRDPRNGSQTPGLDLSSLKSNQAKINDINSAMAMERLRVAISIHDMLSPEQKGKLSHGAVIRIPDPIGVILEKDIGADATEKIFQNSTTSAEQKAKYQSIVKSAKALSESNKKVRNHFLFEREKLLSSSHLEVPALEDIQEKINKLDSFYVLTKVQMVARMRDILTPEQRQEIFSRHQSKLWRNTGISASQEQQIRAIEDKVEFVRNTAAKKIGELALDMRRMYYESGDNDEKILACQHELNKANSEMAANPIEGAFKIRELLSESQRLKLVKLMENDDHS